MRSRTAVRSAVVTAVTLLGLTAATAPGLTAPAVPAGLLLTVSGDSDTWIRGVHLLCEPAPGGQHPRAVDACYSLDQVKGDLDALRVDPRLCTLEYAPVTVTARGEHRGRAIAWSKKFGNYCAMASATGPIFDF
ncbi:SSI family serine proteinase inhibitor [Streptomyces sp. NPDC020965]|uniref:SSI family serine proteinase inhibitor n=1 Tax=Streptomyces sp. NPDC020965 TaxID=3365105 RepID=UPI0037A9E549